MTGAALAFVALAGLVVLAIVVSWPWLARRVEPRLLPAYRAAALTIVAAAYAISLVAIATAHL
ncbi:hypothetical protein AB0E27_20120 [Streptomyces sparsogenes]|uniref:hypothetical protein n=1 Tax=Streptomyces sparsogenes TaxID=67365 RepID=UPI0033C0FA16